jgi:hypothetical protein
LEILSNNKLKQIKCIARSSSTARVFCGDHELVGYALAVSDEGATLFSSFELKRLYMFYRFHGNGLEKRLLGDVLSFAREMQSERNWLEVHEANHQPGNSINTAVLFKRVPTCFAPAKVLIEF